MCEKCCCRNKINNAELFEYLRTWLDANYEFVKDNGANTILVISMRRSKNDLIAFFDLDWVSYDVEAALKHIRDYKMYRSKNG